MMKLASQNGPRGQKAGSNIGLESLYENQTHKPKYVNMKTSKKTGVTSARPQSSVTAQSGTMQPVYQPDYPAEFQTALYW